jgi:PHS family inorganic phosphate transporter-like MFS transporter
MSASIVSDRAHVNKRGTLLAIIFSNQGWGNLIGAVAAVCVIAAYRGPVDANDTHKLSGAWRILQGIALIPAFAVLYFRLTLVESTRFTQARQIQDDPELLAKASAAGVVVSETESDDDLAKKDGSFKAAENKTVGLAFGTIGEKPRNEFFSYFSEWRNLKVLLGCSLSWFLVDITFYGINLNQSTIISALGFTSGSTWQKLMHVATGNLIITCAG